MTLCLHIYMCIFICVYVYIYIYIHMYVCVCAHACIDVCIYVYIYVYMYIYIYMNEWRQSKWNYQIVGETELHLAISHHQMRLPRLGLGYIYLCWLLKGSHGKLQATQSVGKTIGCSPQTDSRPHCWRQHLYNSLSMETSTWYLYRTFNHTH